MVREITALKVLKHPNVVPLLGVHLSKGNLHMLFPFVTYTLQDILQIRPDGTQLSRAKPIQRMHAVALMTQLVDAISYCHSKGVLHRNLKPKHILLTLRRGPGSASAGALSKVSTPTSSASRSSNNNSGNSKQSSVDSDPPEFDLSDAVLTVADFALMRSVSRPVRPLTGEVSTCNSSKLLYI